MVLHRDTNYLRFKSDIYPGKTFEAWRDRYGHWHLREETEEEIYQTSPTYLRTIAGEIITQEHRVHKRIGGTWE